MCANDFLTAAINARINHVEVISPSFCELHKLYKHIYEVCESWYDHFAERMMATDIAMPTFRYTQTAPTSRNRISDMLNDMATLKTAVLKYRSESDAITQTIVDEALVDIDTLTWKLKASR